MFIFYSNKKIARTRNIAVIHFFLVWLLIHCAPEAKSISLSLLMLDVLLIVWDWKSCVLGEWSMCASFQIKYCMNLIYKQHSDDHIIDLLQHFSPFQYNH